MKTWTTGPWRNFRRLNTEIHREDELCDPQVRKKFREKNFAKFFEKIPDSSTSVSGVTSRAPKKFDHPKQYFSKKFYEIFLKNFDQLSEKFPRKIPETNRRGKNSIAEFLRIKIKEEQIEGTQQKPQWIVSQGYSRTYNSWMQQSRLQWIYRHRDLNYDALECLWRRYQRMKPGNLFLFT